MDNKVTAQLLSTSLHGTAYTEMAEAKYLVGTDGGHSRVRKELGLDFEGEKLPGIYIFGDVHMSGMDTGVSYVQLDTHSILMFPPRLLTLGMSMAWDGTFCTITPAAQCSDLRLNQNHLYSCQYATWTSGRIASAPAGPVWRLSL
jgi:2-polyprenyl-6-methoxyphenol hydroxylase-like FAD-dependent oxidoreductase